MERRWKGRGPWVLMCALVLALGVFVAGCGGDDEESGGSSSSGQSSSGGGPDTIRVAILSD